jgi:quinol monooxygenase YgiN
VSMVRVAKIIVDAAFLEPFRAALKEGVESSVRLEPGVKTLYAVSAKEVPTHFTILEIYSDQAAYESHITTSHFLKYKATTQHMVRSLELTDCIALVPEMKIK